MTTLNPFANDKKVFSSVPLEQRGEFLRRMLATPRDGGKPTLVEREGYPHEDCFAYKEHTLHYYHTAPHPEPAALIFYLHGLNSHGGNSSYFGNRAGEELGKVNVYALDFLNFGKSDGGYKGYIPSFEEIVAQGEAFVDHVSGKFTNKPRKVLVGHSLGGAIAFKMTLVSPKKYDQVVFLVPALREVKQSQFIMKKIGKVIGYFLPKIKLTEQGNDDIRYDVEHLVKANELNYNGRNIPGTIRVVLNAMEEIEQLYHEFDTPYVLFQAGVDKLVDPFAPLDLERSCKSKDKTTVYMKDMWHSIYMEEGIKHVVDLALDWLRQRI